MDGIKYSRQFAEMERLVSDYFHCHLAPVMSKTQTFLTKKQGEEMREYSTSLGGILSAMASAAQPMGDPYQVLKVTGEWNSKTTEPYKAAAAVPFKTLILSIFSGDTSKRSDSTGTPSITINGVFPRKENEGA